MNMNKKMSCIHNDNDNDTVYIQLCTIIGWIVIFYTHCNVIHCLHQYTILLTKK